MGNLQLKQIFEGQKQSVDIDVAVAVDELKELEPFDTYTEPLTVKGVVKNRAGIVTADFTVKASLDLVCDRCGKDFQREYCYSFSHTLVHALDNSEDDFDDYVECPQNTLDVCELALTDLKLAMPTKILCKEDCKGLCPVCGSDLNEGDCGCN